MRFPENEPTHAEIDAEERRQDDAADVTREEMEHDHKVRHELAQKAADAANVQAEADEKEADDCYARGGP